MVGAVILAILSGFFWGESMVTVAWIGDLFLKSLKMLIIPLIVSSMVTGILRLGDIRKMGKMGAITLVYYMTTTGLAVATGLLISNTFQFQVSPGTFSMPPVSGDRKTHTLVDVLLGAVPDNIVASMARMDILPVITFSIFFGIVLSTMEEKGRPLREFFFSLEEVILKMVHLVILVSPIGIFGLIAGKLGATGGGWVLLEKLLELRYYAGNVILGLLLHSFVTLPIIYRLFTGKNPFSYIQKLFQALVTAFSTSSSSATLPVTMSCTEEAGVSEKASGFVLPLGATINMDGTALYEAVAVMFIASVSGVHLDFTSQIIVLLTATLAAIGAAGIPEAGLVTMVMVLRAVDLPAEGIGIILAIDWFLDRVRTTVNVLGDGIGAAVVDHLVTGKSES